MYTKSSSPKHVRSTSSKYESMNLALSFFNLFANSTVSDGRKVAQNQRSKSSPTEKNWMGDFDGKLGADQDITQRGFINP